MLLCEGIPTHQVYGLKSMLRLGNLLWRLFMLKVLPSFVKFGMLEEFLILVCTISSNHQLTYPIFFVYRLNIVFTWHSNINNDMMYTWTVGRNITYYIKWGNFMDQFVNIEQRKLNYWLIMCNVSFCINQTKWIWLEWKVVVI